MKLNFRNYPGSKKSTQARPIISTTLIGGFSTQCTVSSEEKVTKDSAETDVGENKGLEFDSYAK